MVIDKCGSCRQIMRKGAVYTLTKSIQPPFYFGITCCLQNSDRTKEWFQYLLGS